MNRILRSRPIATLAALATTVAVVAPLAIDAASDSEATVFSAITPCRLTDTRPSEQVGPRSGALGEAETLVIDARGPAGNCTADDLPAGAVALSLNVTAIGATRPTFLAIWPDGDRPNTSALNPAPGAPPTPNAVTTKLADDGSFRIFNLQGQVDAIVDVVGYHTIADVGSAGPTGPAGPAGPEGPIGPTGPEGPDVRERTVVVSAGGTDLENGAALIAVVDEVDAAGPTAIDSWTIELDTGVYDLGTVRLELPVGVNLIGAGRGVSTIRSANTSGVLLTATGLVSDLTVDATATIGFPKAIETTAAAHFERLEVLSEDDGIWVNDQFSRLVDIVVRASDGIYLNGSDTTITGSDIEAWTYAIRVNSLRSVVSETRIANGNFFPPITTYQIKANDIEFRDVVVEAPNGSIVKGDGTGDDTFRFVHSHFAVKDTTSAKFTPGTDGTIECFASTWELGAIGSTTFGGSGSDCP